MPDRHKHAPIRFRPPEADQLPSGTYRVLVTGSRAWANREAVYQALSEIADKVGARNMVVVHGNARGADRMADDWARQCGAQAERHPADWERCGKRAGMVRNERMVSLDADVVLAFIALCPLADCARPRPHGSHGGSHCADLAEKAGIPVKRYTAS